MEGIGLREDSKRYPRGNAADFPQVEDERKGKEDELMVIRIRGLGQDQVRREGHHHTTDWSQINWRRVHRKVQNLRFRIFRAAQPQDWDKVKELSRLMLKSYSNLLLSIRRVTQENTGHNTPGIDGKIITRDKERNQLADELCKNAPWKAAPVRRLYIPKSNHKLRPLGIPTIANRAMQAVVKNVLEPRFEAEFEAQSYGFRPGRSCHDAIEEIHTALNEGACGKNQYLLDADIKGAFDHINHEFILNRIGNTPEQALVKQWLTAGYIEWGKFHQTTEGTPQGGVATPPTMLQNALCRA